MINWKRANPARYHAVIRAHKHGVFLWRIADDRGLSVEAVLEILVESGTIQRGQVGNIRRLRRAKKRTRME